MRKLTLKILVLINWALAFLLLGSYLSVYINPDKFWFAPFVGLAFPVLLLLNIVFVLFWIYTRKKYLFISLLCIVLGWNNLASFMQFSSPPEYEDVNENDKIRVMSFNIKMINLYKDAESEPDIIPVQQIINQENPEIICLQEYFSPLKERGKSPDILEKFKRRNQHHIEKSHEGFNYALATFSVYPIINKGKIPFDNTLNFCIYTDVKIGQDTIRIYNVHLQSIYFRQHDYAVMDSIHRFYDDDHREKVKEIQNKLRSAFVKRSVQARQVKAHIEDSPYEVIVCGDFNDTPVSYTYRHMVKGLDDAFIESGQGFGGTYIGKFPSFRIDYILHSSMFRALNFRKLNTKVSDHYPVICDIY